MLKVGMSNPAAICTADESVVSNARACFIQPINAAVLLLRLLISRYSG